MKSYSHPYLFFLHVWGLTIGRVFFFISITMWVSAIIGGTRLSESNTVTPDKMFTTLAITFGILWALSITIFFVSALFLYCDNCGKRYLWSNFAFPQFYSSPRQRNMIVRFFIPDELIDRKYKCPHCHSVFDLNDKKF